MSNPRNRATRPAMHSLPAFLPALLWIVASVCAAPGITSPCCCSYHVACAKEAGCTYYCEQYQIACPTHARQFVREALQQTR